MSNPNNVLELKSYLNLPFKININQIDYELKVLSVADIFELLEYIQSYQLKEELNNTAELLDLNDKGKKELLLELKQKQSKITFSNFDEIFKYILQNISIKDIINILAWAINKYNNLNKNIKDIKKELNESINNENFSEYVNKVLIILGIPTNNEEEDENNDGNCSKDVVKSDNVVKSDILKKTP